VLVGSSATIVYNLFTVCFTASNYWNLTAQGCHVTVLSTDDSMFITYVNQDSVGRVSHLV